MSHDKANEENQMGSEDVDRSQLAKGEYANYFEVGHDFVAFYVDCGQVGHSDQKTSVYNRIITSPIGAQRLSIILTKAIQEYRHRFGGIRNEDGMIAKEENPNEF
ncbi:DUF3467 domain-containing protein [Nitrospira sp. Nam80]